MSPKDLPTALVTAHYGVETALSALAVEPGLQALIRLRVSQLNHCSYCIEMHRAEAERAGEGPSRVDGVGAWRDATTFDERERLLLAWAEAMTTMEQERIETLRPRVREHLGVEQLAWFNSMLASINGWNRLMVGCGIRA